MAKHSFTVQLTGEQRGRAIEMLAAAGALLPGYSVTSGRMAADTPLGRIELTYRAEPAGVCLTVEKKPWLLSGDYIESKVRAEIARHTSV